MYSSYSFTTNYNKLIRSNQIIRWHRSHNGLWLGTCPASSLCALPFGRGIATQPAATRPPKIRLVSARRWDCSSRKTLLLVRIYEVGLYFVPSWHLRGERSVETSQTQRRPERGWHSTSAFPATTGLRAKFDETCGS